MELALWCGPGRGGVFRTRDFRFYLYFSARAHGTNNHGDNRALRLPQCRALLRRALDACAAVPAPRGPLRGSTKCPLGWRCSAWPPSSIVDSTGAPLHDTCTLVRLFTYLSGR